MTVPYCQDKQIQKQSSRGVLRKRYFENMQQIYRGTPMPNCDFNKSCFAILLKSHFGMGVLLLKICCISLENFFLRTSLDGYFADSNGLVVAELKGCVRCIFDSLFCKSQEEYLRSKKNIFYFTLEALFVLEIIKFYLFRYSNVMTSSNN